MAGLVPELYETPRRIVFRQEPGRSYRVVYGHSRVSAPSYDLARLTDPKAIDAAAAGTLGPEAVNPDYVDPAPWTERHPILLWIVLAVVVLALGALAVRALQSTPSRAPD